MRWATHCYRRCLRDSYVMLPMSVVCFRGCIEFSFSLVNSFSIPTLKVVSFMFAQRPMLLFTLNNKERTMSHHYYQWYCTHFYQKILSPSASSSLAIYSEIALHARTIEILCTHKPISDDTKSPIVVVKSEQSLRTTTWLHVETV